MVNQPIFMRPRERGMEKRAGWHGSLALAGKRRGDLRRQIRDYPIAMLLARPDQRLQQAKDDRGIIAVHQNLYDMLCASAGLAIDSITDR